MRMMILALALAGCGSNGVATSTDVKLQNATAHPTMAGTYELTFSVVNGASRAIDRVEDVAISTGGAPLQNANAVGCAGFPWTLPPGGASGVVTIDVTFGATPRLSVECDSSELHGTTLLSPPSAPAQTFEVRVQGLFTDAEPFVATATAPIL